MKADNQMKKVHENAPRSEYGNLPLELRAMNEAMKMVFNAVTNAAQQATEHANPQNAKAANPASHGVGNPAGAAPRRMDIETAIMRAPDFDYLLASEIFAALQRRLELRYENLNPQVEEAMQRLAKSFDHVTG